MRVIIFGASGMVGQGVLRECLLAPDVEAVLVLGRRPLGQTDAKLQDRVVPDLTQLASIEGELSGYDACFFCLGTSAAGKSEAEYRRQTYDLTLAAAGTLAARNPGMTFVYVSGAGTDSTEKGRSMWARVKGKTENDLLKLPFKAAYMFRPGAIVPMHGEVSRTPLYRAFYVVAKPLLPLLRALFPSSVVTTEVVGRAMLAVAREGGPQPLIESRDINNLGAPKKT
jgi:uncharacterized protein YbjT (DUF2867 family)